MKTKYHTFKLMSTLSLFELQCAGAMMKTYNGKCSQSEIITFLKFSSKQMHTLHYFKRIAAEDDRIHISFSDSFCFDYASRYSDRLSKFCNSLSIDISPNFLTATLMKGRLLNLYKNHYSEVINRDFAEEDRIQKKMEKLCKERVSRADFHKIETFEKSLYQVLIKKIECEMVSKVNQAI